MPKMLKILAVSALLPLISLTPIAQADDSAVELLNRMNKALHQLNYKGNLAYLKGNSLSTLHVDHSVVNGVESERVVRLNEGGNEISRELKGFSLSSIPQIRPEMEAVYSFDMGRENRVANMPCRVITARPKDRERYLQKYCIDSTTGMLLDYMLVGKSHKPIEQFMFTTIDIRVPEKMTIQAANNTNEKITPLGKIETTILIPQAQAKAGVRHVSNVALEDGWVIEALPAGFEISQAPSMKETSSENPIIKHYIVSDGLSSLSVFVSPITDRTPANAVTINSGALNVLTKKKDNHMITVVGEVPELTLKNIVKNLHKKP
ncbi:MAG: MucB/RseB C-terminal domain-containing protein [Cocleimonas sp.]